MASLRMQRLYERIERGQRVASVPPADMPALRMWLWRHGYTLKTNCDGGVCDVLIDEKV